MDGFLPESGFGGGAGGQEGCSASAGGGAGAGMGGAVFNDQGTLSVYGCSFDGNTVMFLEVSPGR